jgi:hypothetical protein
MRSRGNCSPLRWKPPHCMRSQTPGRSPCSCFVHVTNQLAQVHGDFEKKKPMPRSMPSP